MDRRYDAYCAADPLFYDSLSGDGEQGRTFAAADRPLPADWVHNVHDDWLIYGPAEPNIPRQGWKIHVSGTLGNAERILETVWDYCVPRGISFKFLRSPRVLLMRNSKYASRSSSGKLVTIYPADEDALRTILKELDAKLGGEPGPYILSDLRWAKGPLYVRYGGFAHLYCIGESGQMVPAIVGPDGTFEPDHRGAVFNPPEWVTLPDFLRPHLEARNATSTIDLPYQIEEVLHYSNAGGLYAGVDTRTGDRIVLKEARPHAGLDGHGEDAVTRLHRERTMLERVADVGVTPRVLDAFSLGDHEFVVLEYVEGEPLNRLIVERYPLTNHDGASHDGASHDGASHDGARREYAAWAQDICDQVDRAVRALHERNVVYGDLHMFNIMVRPDGRIALLDFEVAADATEERRPGLRNQGFAAPRDRKGAAVDEYALACLRLAIFLPLTPLLRLDPVKARHFADIIEENFPVDRAFLDKAVDVIAPSSPGVQAAQTPAWPSLRCGPDNWPTTRDALVRAITASATPQRDDRLYPGDIEQFRLGGLGIAHGAAGVLYALAEAGAPIDPEHQQWLADRATQPAFGTRHGFLDGLHGVAYVLDRLGDRSTALKVIESCLDQGWEELGLDLHGGLSGIGLNLLHFATLTDDPSLAAAALRATELLADRLGTVESVPDTSGGGSNPHAGLTHGSAGPALMFLRMYDTTRDSAFLDLAATALRQDLRRCVVRQDGAMEVNEGWRTMPYLAQGSIGIGLVLDEYLVRRPDEEFAVASQAIARAARSPMYVQSGLFAGRAGVVAYLARRIGTGPRDPELDAQISRLVWHGMPYAGGIAFPGEQLLRLSMDLATGTAGVLLALAMTRGDAPAHLPLLGPAMPAHQPAHQPAMPADEPAHEPAPADPAGATVPSLERR